MKNVRAKNMFGFNDAFVKYLFLDGVERTLFSFKKGNLVTVSRYIDETEFHIINLVNGICDFSGEAYSLEDAKTVLKELEEKNEAEH